MVCDTENFLLSQTRRIGFLTVAYMQYVDTVRQCADCQHGNARMLHGSIQCGRSLRMNAQAYALNRRRVLAAEAVMLPLRGSLHWSTIWSLANHCVCS